MIHLMRRLLPLLAMLAAFALAEADAQPRHTAHAPPPAAPVDRESLLCATNPAYSLTLMQSIIEGELSKDHDPSLDAATPEKLAQQALDQGISECAAAMRHDPDLWAEMSSLKAGDIDLGWDAYNTACNDHGHAHADCVRTEIGDAHALKHMDTTNSPPGSRALVEACQLVLRSDPTMRSWRQCVDMTLAVHPTPPDTKRCKLSVNWHMAKTGEEAGAELTQCLKAKS